MDLESPAAVELEVEKRTEKTVEVEAEVELAEQVEETVVFEWLSKKEPNSDAQEEKSLEPDVRAEVPARVEGRIEQPLVLDREAEAPPEIQQDVDAKRTVNLEATAGEPATLEQSPGTKVLLIEDDPTIRMLLEMGLRKHKYDCLVAENGKAAQEILQTTRPDLIVVDLLMPVMDGLAFIQWLRQTARDSTPVLVFTTVNDPKITQEVLRNGADFIVHKPLHLKQLVEAMEKLTNPARPAPSAVSA